LFLTGKYKERLVNAFKTIMTKNRETHVKQLSMACGMSAFVEPPVPTLHLEPQITHLLRLIDAYQFLKTELTDMLGTEFLENISRIKSDGTMSSMNVLSEMDYLINMLTGLVEISCDDLGHTVNYIEYGITVNLTEARDIASDWLNNISKDADLMEDTRVVVPVGINIATDPSTYGSFNINDENYEKNYWATIGVRPVKLKVWYAKEPKAYTTSGNEIDITWEEGEYWVLVDEFIEFKSKKGPWTREEFREMINGKSRDEIREMFGYESGYENNIKEIVPILVGIASVSIILTGVAVIYRKRKAKRY